MFTVMRCWHPRAENVIKEVVNYNPKDKLTRFILNIQQQLQVHQLKNGMIFVKK